MRRTVKKIVTYTPPCTTEMVGLMDCLKRYATGQADNACINHREALAQCAKAAKPPNVSQTKSQFTAELQKLDGSWRRSGF